MSTRRVHYVADPVAGTTAACGRFMFGANVDSLMWAHYVPEVTCVGCLKHLAHDTPIPTRITATVLVTISVDDLASGWAGNRDELGESIRATLHELIGDDGGAYEPIEVDVAGIVAE